MNQPISQRTLLFTMLDKITVSPKLEEGENLGINESSSQESILQISFSWEGVVHIELSPYF